MKKLVILVMLIPAIGFAQEKKEQELTRKERKELKEKEEEEAKVKLEEMVKNGEWVLKVSELRDIRNNHYFLNTANNFIASVNNEGIMQLNFIGIPGFSDIGIRGKIENYKIKNNGKRMYATGTINSVRGVFTFVLYPSTYNSQIQLSGAFNDTLTLIGSLVSPEETVLFDKMLVH